MKCSVYLLVTLVGFQFFASPAPGRAGPASRQSIEWATANSDRVIVGKVIKVRSVNKHDIVTVAVQRTLRGDQERKANNPPLQLTFVVQQCYSGYAEGWLEDKLPMVFFLVKIEGAKRRDKMPKGFKWVLHHDGFGNSAVLLGKTKRRWPGTMDVFTRKFDYLMDPAGIVKFVADYARSIPPNRMKKGVWVRVPSETSAHRKVFPPDYPGNAFYLRVPAGEPKKP